MDCFQLGSHFSFFPNWKEMRGKREFVQEDPHKVSFFLSFLLCEPNILKEKYSPFLTSILFPPTPFCQTWCKFLTTDFFLQNLI